MSTTPKTAERRAPDSGFTLIEVVVALALLALIAGLLVQTIRGARYALATVERNTSAFDIGAVQTMLRQAFAQAVPAANGIATAATMPSFVGGPNRISFKTLYSPRSQIEGLYGVEIGLVPSAERRGATDLVMTHVLLRSEPTDGQNQPSVTWRTTLVPNVDAAAFAYFGKADPLREQMAWVDSWTVPDQLPRLVRIEIRFKALDGRSWPRLEVPLYFADLPAIR